MVGERWIGGEVRGRNEEGGTCKGVGKRVYREGGGGKYELVTWTSNMSSTLRGSTCTEFHR